MKKKRANTSKTKRGRKCKACLHPERKQIDSALVEGASIRDISRRFRMSAAAVARHVAHIPKALAKAKDAAEIADAGTLLGRIERLIRRCESISDKAQRAKQWAPAVSALGQLRGCLELLAKISGEIKDGAIVQVNVSPVERPLSAYTDEELAARKAELLKILGKEQPN